MANFSTTTRTRTPLVALLLAAVSLAGPGCGHSEDEWQAQLAKYNTLKADDDQKTKELADVKQHVSDLEQKLQDAGLQVNKLNTSLDDREKALAEYKARAAQLERIRARFELLRKKLDELTKIGLAVTVRRNRMVISLPGDVLFDSRQDTLKPDGQDVLKKVAAVIRGDRGLASRDYQVAGHTDNLALQGSVYHDNWGLSLMRARAVLVYLITKGDLPQQHWSASGYGDTDPIASNATKDGQQKNRRCDLIVVPDVDEMLDLKALTSQ